MFYRVSKCFTKCCFTNAGRMETFFNVAEKHNETSFSCNSAQRQVILQPSLLNQVLNNLVFEVNKLAPHCSCVEMMREQIFVKTT